MKTKFILLTILITAFTLVTAPSFAQGSLSKREQKKAGQEAVQANEQRLNDAKDLKQNTRSEAKTAQANVKEAKRMQDDADNAAKQAKQAARLEAKAQRNRSNADNQAKKANKAAEKSDRN